MKIKSFLIYVGIIFDFRLTVAVQNGGIGKVVNT